MKKSEVVELLIEHSKLVHFGIEQSNIKDRLSDLEIREFISALVHKLPNYPDSIIEEVNYYCLDGLNEDTKIGYLDNLIKQLLRERLSDKINKEKSALLILILMIDFVDEYKCSVLKEIRKASKYLLSYIIPSRSSLYREIENDQTKGQTIIVNNSYIRIKDNLELIPTIKTIKKYLNYL